MVLSSVPSGSLFLQAGVLVRYFCGSYGALTVKTKQNKFEIFLPQGQLRAQFPAISPYIHQKKCQLWEPVRFPFSPGRWEAWLRCFSLAFGGAPVSTIMLSTRYEALSWEFQDQVVWSLNGPKLFLTWASFLNVSHPLFCCGDTGLLHFFPLCLLRLSEFCDPE